MSRCMNDPLINGIIVNPDDHHAIKTIRGYNSLYIVHDNTLSSPYMKRTWGINTVEEEPN